MGLVLPASFKAQIERAHGTQEPLWLLELVLDPGSVSRPPVILRICDGQERLEWPLGNLAEGGDPDPWYWEPFPFVFSPIEQTQEGQITQIDLSIDNAARMLMRFLHDGHGLEGNTAKLFLVYRNGLSIAYPNHEFQLLETEVQLAQADDEAATFRLGMPNWFGFTSPQARYIPKKCRWDFGSSRCGYVINAFAAFARCPKTIAACTARGADLIARGLPAVLPGNYGGHPGISTQR